ncbi:MAG: DUF4260 domain-containing protein [Chitinophagaceae bacterium]|nr:DUF4260 domain-containing protein [Chitinophagaceae bacterium]
MKYVLKLEELAMTALAIYFLNQHLLGLSWWVWALLFFAPDISMLGYLINTRIGAVCYNIFHHKGIAIIVIAIGYIMNVEISLAIGILLFAHSSFDRIWGYGLKYEDNFKNTHLGML